MTRVVIVGASVGGVRTAQALRSEGYDGDVVLVGEEEDLPYDKPPLSKGVLAGTDTPDSIRLLTREAAEANGIRLVLGARATGVDTAARTLHLAGREGLRYDTLVVATGARARPSPWGERPGIHVLRTLGDARSLRADLLTHGRLAVVGAGLVGAEVAATARSLGLDVTVIDPVETPMARVLEPEVARRVLALHEQHGVRSMLGAGVASIEGERGDFTIALTTGDQVGADVVVVGIGAAPNDTWLGSSGLMVEDGLVCDRYCRAVDRPEVYGVGDVARWFHPDEDRYVRVEHWTNAVEQASCVAHNIVHPEDLRAHAPTEYVWSDQYDWKLQVIGRTHDAVHRAVVGDLQGGSRFAVLYGSMTGALVGAVAANWPRAFVQCRKGIRDGAGLDDVRVALGTRATKTQVMQA